MFASPVTSAAGEEISLDISRDGGALLFKDKQPGNTTWRLNQLDLATGAIHQVLTSELGVVEAAYSPDGARVALVSKLGSTCEIRVVDLSGQQPPVRVDSVSPCISRYFEIG